MNDPRLDSAIVCLNKTVAKLDKELRTEPNFRHRQEATGWTLGLQTRTKRRHSETYL